MNMQGLLAMFGQGGAGAAAAPSLYNTAVTGGASGPGYVGPISPQMMEGLLGMAGQQQQQAQAQAQAPAPMPMMMQQMRPQMLGQMPTAAYGMQGPPGLLGGVYGR